MDYNVALAVTPPDDNLLCAVCFDIFDQPTTAWCKEGHAFFRTCLDKLCSLCRTLCRQMPNVSHSATKHVHVEPSTAQHGRGIVFSMRAPRSRRWWREARTTLRFVLSSKRSTMFVTVCNNYNFSTLYVVPNFSVCCNIAIAAMPWSSPAGPAGARCAVWWAKSSIMRFGQWFILKSNTCIVFFKYN